MAENKKIGTTFYFAKIIPKSRVIVNIKFLNYNENV
jgi:hypothetical protein